MGESEASTKTTAAGALEEEAYRLIRSALINSDFTPGSKFSIGGVCAALSLSPMPVRAALPAWSTSERWMPSHRERPWCRA
ncbi:MAG: GntR family transcriptional regulator [Mesorhizobium sp.]|uniref:GntR family transcriptional regulator n=1 Tax=Mesorhizobium sp. M5C.F.Cr.IN.023.01.1.1 TaxID=2496768 RepID=UPI000FC9C733|nr:GntR family transcriptional regulator [Mesorhizobium sp. M5C.F.Cr.IN.023.01.1.1]RUV67717.1 GntR family transcriptional regulator [Mesorhizobium sp. M5C.F.Cr.IN.023.01.1.1]RWC98823.1 MAG: GntR family transcriptional regulator [Mesorhizobium sp.]